MVPLPGDGYIFPRGGGSGHLTVRAVDKHVRRAAEMKLFPRRVPIVFADPWLPIYIKPAGYPAGNGVTLLWRPWSGL